MLTLMFRRLAVTGLLVSGFIGAGVLFDQGAISALSANAAAVSAKTSPMSGNAAELGVADVAIEGRRGQARLNWPFFSFRKGGR
jgi:hypothetical protein